MFLLTYKILFPYFDSQIVTLDTESEQGVLLIESGACRKPWISYNTLFGVVIDIMFYDEAMENEAAEKGAAWLISKLEPNGTNVYNYEETIKSELEQGHMYAKGMMVYEKEYNLDDRSILSMVIDNSANEYPLITVYFVYDNILARVYGHPEIVESILPHLSFYEINPNTMEQLSDIPGSIN